MELDIELTVEVLKQLKYERIDTYEDTRQAFVTQAILDGGSYVEGWKVQLNDGKALTPQDYAWIEIEDKILDLDMVALLFSEMVFVDTTTGEEITPTGSPDTDYSKIKMLHINDYEKRKFSAEGLTITYEWGDSVKYRYFPGVRYNKKQVKKFHKPHYSFIGHNRVSGSAKSKWGMTDSLSLNPKYYQAYIDAYNFSMANGGQEALRNSGDKIYSYRKRLLHNFLTLIFYSILGLISLILQIRFVAPLTMRVLNKVLNGKKKIVEFGYLKAASKINIRTNLDKPVSVVNNIDVIRQVLAFLEVRQDGWYQPWYGTPVGSLVLNCYSDDELLGSIEIGEEFLIAHHFATRNIQKSESAELCRIIGLPDYDFSQ